MVKVFIDGSHVPNGVGTVSMGMIGPLLKTRVFGSLAPVVPSWGDAYRSQSGTFPVGKWNVSVSPDLIIQFWGR